VGHIPHRDDCLQSFRQDWDRVQTDDMHRPARGNDLARSHQRSERWCFALSWMMPTEPEALMPRMVMSEEGQTPMQVSKNASKSPINLHET
jgi:hypothetical protein